MTTTLQTPAMLALIQGWEWIIILVIGLLLFGRRLPEIGRSIGKTIVEFKKGMNEVTPDMNAPVQGTPTHHSGTPTGHPGAHQAPGALPSGHSHGAPAQPQGADPYAKGNYPQG